MSSSTAWSTVNGATFTGFSVKATVLYIGVSLGVLMIVLLVLSLSLIYCVRPGRRRQQALVSQRQQREAALRAVKTEEEVFKPQVRPFPVIILQPGAERPVLGKLILDDSSGPLASEEQGCVPSAADPEDPETGETSSRASERAEDSRRSEQISGGDGASASPGSQDGSFRCSSPHATSEAPKAAEADEPESPTEPDLHYNPLTHYLTDRHARYFVATVDI